MTQQLVLEPLGIITEPNKLGQIPAGALSEAKNVVIRSPGIIETLPRWDLRATLESDAGTTAAFVITPPGSQMLVIFNKTAGWFYRWYGQVSGGNAGGPLPQITFTLGGQAYPQSIPLNVQPGFSYVIHGKQLFVNMFSTVIVWDTYEPTNLAERTPRPAGLFPPQLRAVNVNAAPGAALTADRYAHYVAIYKRQVGDTLMVSAPSSAMTTFGNVYSAGANVACEVLFNELVKAGDVLEIYRTKSKPAGSGAFATYQRGEEAGSEYQKATSVTLTAAQIAGGLISVVDSSADANLGEALYTNQAVQGSLGAAAYPPPALRFMASHKGYVFGFGTTMPPSITLRPTGTWASNFGDTAQAQAGIGDRQLTGCTWSAGGPPTVVSVSPTSQLGFVRVGMNAIASGAFNDTVTAIGASTFTVSGAASVSGSATSVGVFDLLQIAGSTLFASDWKFVPNDVGTEDELMLIAPALKLPPVSPGYHSAQPTDGFTIRRKLLNDARTTFGVKGSAEKNWDPGIAPYNGVATTPATIENKPRAMVWSDQNQPESWPFVNNDTFARGLPCAFASTRDCIIAFYTDAIWRISGTGGTARDGFDWRADPIVTGVTIQGSQAVCVLHDVVYAMTSEGFISIDGSNMRNLSKGRIHDQLACPPWTDGAYSLSTACFLVADEEHNEIIMREPSAAESILWIYNVATDTFSQATSHYLGGSGNAIHGDYSRTLRAPVIVGYDASFGWGVRVYSGASPHTDTAIAYQAVYADNPFAQRQWQSVDVAVDLQNPGPRVGIQCNGVSTSTSFRAPTNGRLSAEVPRNAPAIGNTMAIRVQLDAIGGFAKISGVALNYRDQTDRRRKR